MTDNLHNEKSSAIENWHIKDDRKLKAIDGPIPIIYKNKEKDFEKDDLKNKDLRPLVTEKKDCVEIMQQNNDIEKQIRKLT